MEPNKEDNVSLTPTAQITAPPVPGFSALPPVVPPSFPPPMAPIPMMPHPPVSRPPTFRPPLSQNGETKTSDSDSDSDDEHFEISEGSRQVRERQEKAMQDLMVKRRTAAVAVPTNDKSVRDRLRRLGEPITLFGEQEMERRARLAQLMGRLDMNGQLDKLLEAHDEDAAPKEEVDDDVPEYPFFTEGPKELREARIEIAKFSTKRAAVRIQRAKRRRDDPDEDMDAETKWALKQARNMVLDCSNFGDDRPLTGCSFSRDGKILATCSLSGVTKLWEMPQVTKKIAVLKDHKERATEAKQEKDLRLETKVMILYLSEAKQEKVLRLETKIDDNNKKVDDEALKRAPILPHCDIDKEAPDSCLFPRSLIILPRRLLSTLISHCSEFVSGSGSGHQC